MAPYINDNHILYYSMDTYRLLTLCCNYFTSPDYLVVQVWIRAIFLHPTKIIIAGTIFHFYSRFFPMVVGYFHSSNTIVPCHQNIAVVNVLHNFIVTTCPIP